MNKRVISLIYLLLTLIFVILTLVEIIIYISMNSNLLGLLYLFGNFFIIYILFMNNYNYIKTNIKVRISNNIVIVMLGIFLSFILFFVIPILLTYSDESYLFNESVYVISKVLKPIIYVIILTLTIFDIRSLIKK